MMDTTRRFYRDRWGLSNLWDCWTSCDLVLGKCVVGVKLQFLQARNTLDFNKSLNLLGTNCD